MKKFNYIFDAFQDFFVGLAVTATVTISLGTYIDIKHFILDVFIAFIINYITGLIINTRKLAGLLSEKLRICQTKKTFVLLQVLVNTFIYVTVISVCMFIIKVGITPVLRTLLKKTYLKLIVVAYIVGYVMAPVSAKITSLIINKLGGRKKHE